MRNSKKKYLQRLRPLVFAFLFTLTAPCAFAGPVIAPGQKLFLIKTEHFDIIFPEASRPSAQRLSTMADSVYDEVSIRLKASLPRRVPVVITPDISSFNGYTNPIPYMHIVLYDTSLDIGWTTFKDNFRNLFLHELTHAVSLQVRAPWASFLSGIFGSWVLPGALNAPEFMVEGIAVSFESDDPVGGRANDPLVKERVRQDIIENRFKSPIEASGIYDEYPYGNIYYEYGGLFNAYIQKAYGPEKYAELWKAMGTLIFTFTLDPYEIGFYKAFHRTYGMPFLKAWADFRSSLTLESIVDPPEILGPKGLARMPDGLAGNERSLYWVDARANNAMRMDVETQRTTDLFAAGSSYAISDASPSDDRLLVSRAINLPDGRDRTETIVYDLGRGGFVAGSAVPDMREARFFRDGFVGIVSRLHNTDLVLSSKEGPKILLSGSEEVMYSQPVRIDDRRVGLIVAVGGRRSIGILDVDAGTLSLVRPEGADAELLTYVRQLSASQGKLYFNYNCDDRLYKLGVLDTETGSITIETTDYSGGVMSPRVAAGRVYYLGRFSEGDKLCRYPTEPAPSREVPFGLEDFDPRATADAQAAIAQAPAAVLPYRPLAYANPFNAWIAYPDLTVIDRSLRLFGLFYFQDPTADNTLLLNAGYDTGYPFADASLTWTNQSLPVSFGLSLGDNLIYGAIGAPERQSSAGLTADLVLPAFTSPRYAALELGGSAFARADGWDGSPYSWSYSGWNATASAAFGWFGRISGAKASTARGIDIVSYHDLDIASLTYKTEEHLVASYDRFPLRLDLWGAWASSPILRLDSTSRVFSADRRPAYTEYESLVDTSAEVLVEGTVAYRLANQAIHSNLLDLYFNRLLIDVGFRGAYLHETVLASYFARLSLDLGAAEGMAAGRIRVFGEAFSRIDAGWRDNAFGWRLGLQTSTDLGVAMRKGGLGPAQRSDSD